MPAPKPRCKASSARCACGRSGSRRSRPSGSFGRTASPRRASRSRPCARARPRPVPTLTALANLPAEIEQRRGRLLDAIAAAERERGKAADDLAMAETELKRREKALREVQEKLAGAREARARSRGAARIGARAAERGRPRHPRAARLRAGSLSCARRHEARRTPPRTRRGRGAALEAQRRSRAAWRRQSPRRGGRGGHLHAARGNGAREGRCRAGDREAPPGHLQSEPRRPQTAARSLRQRERAFPAPVPDPVRRRHRRAAARRVRTIPWNPGSRSSPARPASARKR